MDSNTVISLAEISQYLWNAEIPKQNQFFNGTIDPSKSQQLYLARKALQYGVDQNLSGLPGLTNYVYGLCGAQLAIAEEILSGGSIGGNVIAGGSGSFLSLTTNGTSGVATLVGSVLNIPNYTSDLSNYLPLTGGTLTGDLSINKTSGKATLFFPANIGIQNDAAFIQHQETTTDIGIMRFSVSDNDLNSDYFVFGNTDPAGGVGFKERFKLLSTGVVTLGTWNGSPIADAYISSASTWNAKQNAITLTTIGTSGAATFVGSTLNIPNYTNNGLTSLNNLTSQVQFLSTGTSGTDFNISSATDTHTFNLPVASALNTGKLSSTDWTTFNNKLSSATAAATYVPYIGATANVNLGTFDLFAAGGSFNEGLTTYAGINTTGITPSTGGNFVEIGTTSTTYVINAINRTSGNYNYPLFINAQKIVLNSTSGGPVGIGVNPSAWGVNWRPLQMGSYGSFITGRTDENSMVIGKNSFFDGTNWIGTTTGWAQQMFFDSSGNTIFRSANATISNTISFVESLRIQSDGVLKLSTTTSIPSDNNTIFSYSTNGFFYIQGGTTGLALAGSGNRNNAIYVNTTLNQINFATNDGLTKMQLNSAGNLNIGTLGTGIVYSNAGTLTSTNPSDSRLKINIQNVSRGLSDILKLRPVSFIWKDDKINQGIQFGFIAQEVQQVMPEAIKEFGDDITYLGIEKDAIYTTLVKAIQEQNQIIKNLETRIISLESKY